MIHKGNRRIHLIPSPGKRKGTPDGQNNGRAQAGRGSPPPAGRRLRIEGSLRNRGKRGCEGGFALVAAILACVILLALALLVINLSTQDLKSSAKNVGDKKAAAAAETGIHKMMQNFDPQNLSSSAQTNIQVDPNNDPNSVYTIGTPTRPTTGPTFLPLTGFSIGGGQSWGQARYVVDVTGRNTAYGTSVTIGTGVGFGPIEISTMSR